MFRFKRHGKGKPSQHKQLKKLEDEHQQAKENLSKQLRVNEEKLQEVFKNCSDVVFRYVKGQDGALFLVVYMDGMISSQLLDEHILKGLMRNPHPSEVEDSKVWSDQLNISVGQSKTLSTFEQIPKEIVRANAIVLTEGHDSALALDIKGWDKRALEEPSGESVIRGPREGFSETFRVNTTLIRRRLKTPRLKIEMMNLGELSQTDIGIVYVDGLINPSVLTEVKKRVERIKIDGILESGYVEAFIEDAPFSPFPTVQHTERPDTVVSALLEGKAAVIVDGTPFVLVVPFTFFGGLQASEDAYERFMYGTAIRWVRYLLFTIALFLPSVYVAIISYHPEMVPFNLLLSFAAAREPSPFPTIIETLMMEIIFESLREAGIRLPKLVGPAVSIVGALVLGEAAVQAGLVTAPVVIVVAGTGIASFAVPGYSLGLAYRLLRFPMLILGGVFGLFGVMVGALALLLHLVSLRSFGVPYLAPMAPLVGTGMKDVLWRAPVWMQRVRPKLIVGRTSYHMPKGQKPGPKK
ncbi:spore germination protein [Halobacillus sp. A5]|uniref:spore germination protein n=1 Tax=Halobacillus sp. A5 TaxID=2880263 RepID=UPI0020A6A2FD|nr:spore germination protein [Halobacillus sp. A5]MCP3028795.1 spore germination protein [Halobacillus sp. A5]